MARLERLEPECGDRARVRRIGRCVSGASWIYLAIAWLLISPLPRVHAARSPEYQLKAAFLFNFAKFIEWPAAAEDTTLSLGILGDDPFGEAFDPIEGQMVGGRRLAVRRSVRLDELEHCHMLFVCPSEQEQFDEILAHFKGRDVLLVGDVEGFARRGGMINFFLHGNKLRFEVNVNALERTDLKVSSKLLKLGQIVRDEE
ncbi:MAG: YfiR family protein [Acidobacteriota bacterium]